MCVIQGSVQGWVDPFFVLSNCRTVPRGGLTGDRVAPLTRGVIISARCLHRPLASGPEPSPRAGRLQRPKQLRASPRLSTANNQLVQATVQLQLGTEYRSRLGRYHQALAMAGERKSAEADRKLESGTAKGAPEASSSSGGLGGLHPAFFIA